MYSMPRFLAFLQTARNSQPTHPQDVETFFNYSRSYMQSLEDRKTYLGERLLAESQTNNDLQAEVDMALNTVTDAQHTSTRLKFQSIVHRVLKKNMQQRNVALTYQNYQFRNELSSLQDTNDRLEEETVALTRQNTKLTTDFTKELADQNARLAEEANKMRAVNAARTRDGIKLTKLKDKLQVALTNEEQTAQQNNILLSQMNAMQDKHSILNPVHWGKTEWSSFAVGAILGEQIVEQYTPYKPIRNLARRCAKRVCGRGSKQRVPDTLKPVMTPVGECSTHVGVPLVTVPAVQVHN